MFSQSLSKVSILAITLSITPSAKASEKLNVSGFIGVGFAYASDNNFLGQGNQSNEILDAGLKAYYEINNNFSVSGQITYRRLGDLMNDSKPRIDFAAVNWSTRFVGETNISIGRVKPQLGLYNVSRDMPTSRPTIIMPQSIYSDFFRDISLSFDGARVGTNFDFIDGTVSFEAVYGDSNLDANFNTAVVGDLSRGHWEGESALSLDARYVDNNITIAASFSKLHPSFEAGNNSFLDFTGTGLIIPLSSGELSIKSYHLGIQFNTENIEYTAELLVRKNGLGGIIPVDETTSEGYYGQIRYSFSPSIIGTFRYENYRRNKDQKKGDLPLIPGIPDHANTSKTSTFGLSWQLSPSWMVAADIHLVEGAGWLAPLTATTVVAYGKKHWQLMAVQAVYRF